MRKIRIAFGIILIAFVASCCQQEVTNKYTTSSGSGTEQPLSLYDRDVPDHY